MNRRDQVLDVRSTMKSQDLSTSRKKEGLRFDRPLDVDPTLVMSQGVHRQRAISAVIIITIDGQDQLT